MKLKSLLLLGLLTGLHGAYAANLLTNGSFESPSIVNTNAYSLFNTGSSAIAGWTVVGGDIQLTPDTFMGLLGSNGRQWVDLTGIYGYGKGLMSDAVATVIGQTYTLGFDVGNYIPFGSSTLGVSINNGIEQSFTNVVNGSGSAMEWEHRSLSWVASSTTLQVQFLGRANGSLSNNGVIGLDNVTLSVSSVPEPESYVLLLAGLAALGAAVRYRKEK